MRMLDVVAIGGLLLSQAGCGSGEPGADGGSVGAAWSVSAEPRVVIGQTTGEPEYLFQQIAGALLLPDDRIVVADGGIKVLRVYGSDGRFLVEMGGSGEGPGEFQRIAGIWLASHEAIGVFDSRTMRFTTYRADGSLESSQNLVPPAQQLPPGANLDVFVGAFSDGSVGVGWLAFGGNSASRDIQPDRFILGRFAVDGRFLGMMGEEAFFHRHAGSPVAFTPIPYTAVFGDSLYFTEGQRPEISVRDRDGNVGRTITVPAAPKDVDAALAALEEEIRDTDNPFNTVERLHAAPRPEGIPYIAGMLVDDAGFVWAREYEAPEDALWLSGFRHSGGRWWVVDPAGQTVATIDMPEGLRPLDIRGNLLVGVTLDELDVQRIVIHEIQR